LLDKEAEKCKTSASMRELNCKKRGNSSLNYRKAIVLCLTIFDID